MRYKTRCQLSSNEGKWLTPLLYAGNSQLRMNKLFLLGTRPPALFLYRHTELTCLCFDSRLKSRSLSTAPVVLEMMKLQRFDLILLRNFGSG